MDDDARKDVALWRLGVLGPLISARLEHGDRQAYFQSAAERLHQQPDGRLVRLSPRTIESWYRTWRRGGFSALMPEVRSDRGQSRAIDHEVAELIVRLKREKPRRSIRRIIRILERAHKVTAGKLSRSSVHRLLHSLDISGRPLRGASAERRSFIMERAGDLWLGDALHGPFVLGADGKPHKSYMLSQFDVATRYVPHSYFALSEGAVAHEHGFKEAILKYGPPAEYYVDLGSAYIARSLRIICAELGIRLVHTAPGDAEAKGGIERWHRTWREEVGDELGGRLVTLQELNSVHWAWLHHEYHSRKHETTGQAPREHFLAQAKERRPLPRGIDLDEVFLHREKRKVRTDGTVRFQGDLLEVRPELSNKWVELRFDPADPDALPHAFVDGKFACDTFPLDRGRNASRRRRRDLGTPDPAAEPSGLDPLDLIERDAYRREEIPGRPRRPSKER
jgi:putative transposase